MAANCDYEYRDEEEGSTLVEGMELEAKIGGVWRKVTVFARKQVDESGEGDIVWKFSVDDGTGTSYNGLSVSDLRIPKAASANPPAESGASAAGASAVSASGAWAAT